MNACNDHYATLGIAKDAEAIVIRAAFKALSQRYHPDKCPPVERVAAHRRMSEINRAFDVLSDPALRRSYDDQQSCRPSNQEPESGSSSPVTGLARAAIVRRLAPIGIVAGTGLLAMLVAVEKKPWWELTWQFVTSGLQQPSSYAVNWQMLIVIVCVGLRLAWVVRRTLRRVESP